MTINKPLDQLLRATMARLAYAWYGSSRRLYLMSHNALISFLEWRHYWSLEVQRLGVVRAAVDFFIEPLLESYSFLLEAFYSLNGP